MRLAIVGSSVLSLKQIGEASWIVDAILFRFLDCYGSDLTFTSGGAEGVDTLSEQLADGYQIHKKIFLPGRKGWEDRDGLKGFKTRNIEVAEFCDYMVCIRSRTSKTYGSGWTADYAEKTLKKTVRRLYV